ncbi:MAG: ATP-dependent DNA helicase RecG [Methylophilaceae bacterium]
MKSFFTPHQEKLLNKLNIQNWFDLLLHLPVRYEDRTKITDIQDLKDNAFSQVLGKVIDVDIVFRGKRNLVVQLEDGYGDQILLRYLHFYPNQKAQFKVGKYVLAAGNVRKNLITTEIIHPETAVFNAQEVVLPESFTPIYSVTSGLGQKNIYRLINKALEFDYSQKLLNFEILNHKSKIDGVNLLDSLYAIHQPNKNCDLKKLNSFSTIFHQHIKYAELLSQQLYLKLSKDEFKNQKSKIFTLKNNNLKDSILNSLPFKLTESQEQVIHEIESDMSSGKAMHRLLQGDVGSGKTIVAVIVSTLILNNEYQVAFMAPTEILANQHFKKIKELFQSTDVRVELLTGSIKGRKRNEIIDDIGSGKIHYVIGTHALFQDNIYFKKLGLCIIDEQHRFGVKQRLDLMSKGKKHGHQPHLLMMSATPIPRTLSMSYFADLEVSTLSELPKDRVPIVTKLVRDSRRKELMQMLKNELDNDNQIYWVCPLVEESEKLTLSDAVNTYEEFISFIPKEMVGVIHGRMKDQEKDEVMSKYLEKKIKLLVATTVIEVGVDVPNASFMVIEHAERMGLSQLHQLRGRVGRGAKKSTCILIFKENLSELAKQRLKIIYENQDGFLIAENDLKIRGPGEMIGTRQSGVPGLRIANLIEDADLVKEVSDYSGNAIKSNKPAAQRFVEFWFQDKNYLRI